MEFDRSLFLSLGLILLLTKVLGIIMRKLGLPQVVGGLLTGIILGPALLGVVVMDNILAAMAQIGVIMIMFSAGLETNLKEIKQTGIAAIVVTLLGVIVPLGGGYLVAHLMTDSFRSPDTSAVLSNLFYGLILTATSVGITVEALKEMGALKTKFGTCIVAAAVLDDIIGVVLLSFVIGSHSGETSGTENLVKLLLFFVFLAVVGSIVHFLFKWLSKKYPSTRRLPILSLAICFLFSWASEKLFGVADITGAFFAGMLLSNMTSTQYTERKIDINSYMLFSPLFFASIGLNADFSGFTMNLFWFTVVFVLVGIATKVIGCGIGARLCKFNSIQSLRIGIGMMSRGEVALIMASMGTAAGIISGQTVPAIIILVILSSILTPILMKLTFHKKAGIMVAEPPDSGGADIRHDYLINSDYEMPLDVSIEQGERVISQTERDEKEFNDGRNSRDSGKEN